MECLRGASSLLISFLLLPAVLPAQNSAPAAAPGEPAAAPTAKEMPQSQISPAQVSPAQTSPADVSAAQAPPGAASAPPIPAHAPHMSRQTRLEIIRDFETQLVYARTAFPMGTKGLKLQSGVTSPNGEDLQRMLALWGPAVKPGDPAHISFVQIKDDHIHFDINGGAIRRKKWYEHITIAGANNTEVPLANGESQQNVHGSYLDVYFEKYVPEMTAAQLRDVLLPVLDFNAKNKEQAYLDTLPPKIKSAIQAHHVLVGMNSEMVLHARGKPPKKVREKDGETGYEEWIYGDPPQDVDFVRIVNDEVVRVETMRVGGEKIVRTEREVILERPDKDTEAKKEQEERPANAPSLRRPGEDQENVPKSGEGAAPAPITVPQDPRPPGGSGPGELIASGS